MESCGQLVDQTADEREVPLGKFGEFTGRRGGYVECNTRTLKMHPLPAGEGI